MVSERTTKVCTARNNPRLCALAPKYPCSTSPLSAHALSICPLLGPEGAFGFAPSLLARLYFFIRPSGGCQSPIGCQSTLILIRTWVLSGVNGSQQLSTGLSQSYCNSYITHCRRAHTHTHIKPCIHASMLLKESSHTEEDLRWNHWYMNTSQFRSWPMIIRKAAIYLKVFRGTERRLCLIFHVSKFARCIWRAFVIAS